MRVLLKGSHFLVGGDVVEQQLGVLWGELGEIRIDDRLLEELCVCV